MWVGEPPHTPAHSARQSRSLRAFCKGSKPQKIGVNFRGLGVKLWVVDDGLSQCRAILNGVAIGGFGDSCYQQGKQSARLSAWHEARG